MCIKIEKLEKRQWAFGVFFMDSPDEFWMVFWRWALVFAR